MEITHLVQKRNCSCVKILARQTSLDLLTSKIYKLAIISQGFPFKHTYYHILKKSSLSQLVSSSYTCFPALDALYELIIKIANVKEAKWKIWEQQKNFISFVTEKTYLSALFSNIKIHKQANTTCVMRPLNLSTRFQLSNLRDVALHQFYWEIRDEITHWIMKIWRFFFFFI